MYIYQHHHKRDRANSEPGGKGLRLALGQSSPGGPGGLESSSSGSGAGLLRPSSRVSTPTEGDGGLSPLDEYSTTPNSAQSTPHSGGRSVAGRQHSGSASDRLAERHLRVQRPNMHVRTHSPDKSPPAPIVIEKSPNSAPPSAGVAAGSSSTTHAAGGSNLLKPIKVPPATQASPASARSEISPPTAAAQRQNHAAGNSSSNSVAPASSAAPPPAKE